MKLMALFLLFTSDLSALQSSFDHGKQVAESSKNGIEDQIKSGANKAHVPQYQDGVFINKEELSRPFEHLEGDPHGRDLRDIHKTRKPYILDDTEDFMMRSENVHQHPEQAFEETEEVEEGVDSFTIETCEECPDEEYFVKARKTKKRYVYLQTPPYNYGRSKLPESWVFNNQGRNSKRAGGDFQRRWRICGYYAYQYSSLGWSIYR